MDKCPICSSPAKIQGNGKDYDNYSDYDIECFRCGKFNIIMWKHVYNMKMFKELEEIKQISKYQIANISGWIRENQGIIIDKIKLKSLMTLKTPTVSEKADKIFKYLEKEFPIAGLEIYYSFDDLCKFRVINEKDEESWGIPDDLLPIVGVGHIVSSEELQFIWKEYLIKTKKLISSERPRIITPAGWAYLESLRQANPESKKAFVAMWFEPEMEKIYDGFIAKAIKDAGYNPIQIGRKEHNDDINDAIIGEIRNSKFIVADFTGNRGGVYYEAGFAYGLNIPVIYTCKKDQLKNVHFDVNHRNIIDWKNGDDLYNKLLYKINSTIP